MKFHSRGLGVCFFLTAALLCSSGFAMASPASGADPSSASVEGASSIPSSAAGAPFRILTEWKTGGAGGWGYPAVDAARRVLYIPRGTSVMAVDLATGNVTGEVKGMVDARRVALDAAGKYGYVTDMTDGTAGWVRVFDRASLRIVATAPVGLDPDAIVFDPVTKSVFAFSTPSGNVTVIDATTNRIVSSVALPGRVTAAAADGKGAVFATLEDRGQVLRLDAHAGKVSASWPVAGCTGPTGLALDSKDERILVGCENRKIVSLDPASGQVTEVSKVGDGPGNLALDPQRGLLFCGDGSGQIAVLRHDAQGGFSPVQTVAAQAGARMSALDEETGRLYVVTSKFGMRLGKVSEELRFRPTPVPDTFVVLAIGR